MLTASWRARPRRCCVQKALIDADKEIAAIAREGDPAERARRAKALRARCHPDKHLASLRSLYEELSKHVNSATEKWS